MCFLDSPLILQQLEPLQAAVDILQLCRLQRTADRSVSYPLNTPTLWSGVLLSESTKHGLALASRSCLATASWPQYAALTCHCVLFRDSVTGAMVSPHHWSVHQHQPLAKSDRRPLLYAHCVLHSAKCTVSGISQGHTPSTYQCSIFRAISGIN